MGASMRRREFIFVIGGAAIASPSAVALGQQQAMPLIGFLSSRSPHESAGALRAFHEGLAQTGYSEGRNISIEYRWGEGRYDRLQALAEDLVRLKIAVLVTTGGEPSALAAKAATSTISHVFTVGGDPVKIGLVQSIGRPGGNSTGVGLMTSIPEAKRLGLLQQVAPGAFVVGVLINPLYQEAQTQLKELQEAARVIGRTILPYQETNSGVPLGGSRLKWDSVAEVGQAFEEAIGLLGLGATVEVLGAEVLIGSSVLEHVIDGGEDGSRDGNDCLLCSAPRLDTVELGAQVAVLLIHGGPGSLHQSGLEPR